MHKIPTCFFHDLYQNDEFYDSPTYLIVYHDNIWDKGECEQHGEGQHLDSQHSAEKYFICTYIKITSINNSKYFFEIEIF